MYLETCATTPNPIRVSALMSPDRFIADIRAANKADVLKSIANHMARLAPSLSAQTLLDVLLEREELGSTGIEAGVAIPHGRLRTISTPILVIGKTATPVDFGAVDEMPSDLFFTLLAPTSSNDHLRLLSRLARLFQLPNYIDRLRYCRTAEQMHLCFQNWEEATPC